MSYIEFEQKFFGRNDTLNLLKRRLLDLKEGYRQNVALLGNKYIGKSSILHNFILNNDDKDVVCVYLDLENKDFNYLFSKFVGSLLYNFSRNKNLPLNDDLGILLETTKGLIPYTVQVIQKIKSDYEAKKVNDAFLGLITIPEVFTNETGSFCLLIIDEFQNLEDFALNNPFQFLGQKIMTQKRCLYILSSSYPVLAKKILSEKLSLLFGNFETLNVDSFDLKSSQLFIESNLSGLKIGAQLRNFLTDFTGGHPLYFSLICKELRNLAAIYNQNEIYMPLLSQAVENTIFNKWGVISRHFELMINELCGGKGNQVVAAILMSFSNGKNKLENVVDDIGSNKNQVKIKVNKLIELGYIEKNGNYHYLKDKLFKYWIKYVYQKRIKDVELAADRQKKQFKDEFNRSIDNFKASSRKDLSSRIVELLHCFDDESFDLNGRRYKLTNFKEVESAKYKNDGGVFFDVIKAYSPDEIWLFIMKKEPLGENEVNAIVAEAKKNDRRPEKCIIISLSDLDANARVKALQERFWIWNEAELNTLLTLFDKPFILS